MKPTALISLLSFIPLISAGAPITPDPSDGITISSSSYYGQPGSSPSGHVQWDWLLLPDFSAIKLWLKFGDLTYPLPHNATSDVDALGYAVSRMNVTIGLPLYFPADKYKVSFTDVVVQGHAYLDPRVSVKGAGNFWLEDLGLENPNLDDRQNYQSKPFGLERNYAGKFVKNLELGMTTDVFRMFYSQLVLEFKGRGRGRIGLNYPSYDQEQSRGETPVVTIGLKWEEADKH